MTETVPKEKNDATHQLIIDGVAINFSPGQTVIQAATEAGIYIPHLCFSPKLSLHGSCKLCLVSEGEGYFSACTMKAKHGMNISNNSPRLQKLRLQLIEMLFSEGNHYCPSCEVSGNCQLQALAYELGMTHSEFPLQYPLRQRDGSHQDIFIDRDRCINCELCVRASRELDAKNVFSLGGRGQDTELRINSVDGQLQSSNLIASDLSTSVCPVGAIIHKHNNYTEVPGERLYDHDTISEIGNKRPALINGGIDEN